MVEADHHFLYLLAVSRGVPTVGVAILLPTKHRAQNIYGPANRKFSFESNRRLLLEFESNLESNQGVVVVVYVCNADCHHHYHHTTCYGTPQTNDNKNLAIANRSRVSCINTNNNIMTLKSGLEVTQCH